MPATAQLFLPRNAGFFPRAVTWYQPHTTEAGFHMIGRLAKSEVKLVQALCSHKAEEAEHGL